MQRLKFFLELKAIYCDENKDYKKALILFDSCILLESNSGNIIFLGDLYERQLFVYYNMNLNQLGVKSLFKSIECFKKAGNLDKQGSLYFTLGNIYFMNQQFDKAFLAFVESSQNRIDSFEVSIGWIFAARCLLNTGNLKLAGEYIRKGKSIIYSPTPYQPFYYYSVYGTWLSAMNKKKEALQNFKKAVPLAVKGGQLYQKAATLVDIAEIYIGLKRFDNAKKNLSEAIKIADSVNVIRTAKVRKVF
ncbi:MAG: tetratricopeptide repeat protein [Saprospiraceae bacterium]|nr:tetratricopeptide repeat protein [Saprospiraceae bacterium]